MSNEFLEPLMSFAIIIIMFFFFFLAAWVYLEQTRRRFTSILTRLTTQNLVSVTVWRGRPRPINRVRLILPPPLTAVCPVGIGAAGDLYCTWGHGFLNFKLPEFLTFLYHKTLTIKLTQDIFGRDTRIEFLLKRGNKKIISRSRY